MLLQLYEKLNEPEKLGKDFVLPQFYVNPIYISESGEVNCYLGICETDESRRSILVSSPSQLHGKHSSNCSKIMLGMYRLINGSIYLSRFVDSELYEKQKFKHLKEYIIRLPYPNSCYFGVLKRSYGIDDFKENEELTSKCFGLTYSELEILTEAYAKVFGLHIQHARYPRITRSLKSDHFCDITNTWIPKGFPYITFSNCGYKYSTVSLYGFYRHVCLFLSIFSNSTAVGEFKKILPDELIVKITNIDDFPSVGTIITREMLYSTCYVD